jgi:hypothetical protein
MTQIRFDKNLLEPEVIDTSLWPTVNKFLLSEGDLTRYERLENAIRGYLIGIPVKEICKEFDICRGELGRLLQRCITLHSDGRIWGWRALISHSRQQPYRRNTPVKSYPSSKKGGCSGALTQLFARFPHIQELVHTLFLKKESNGIIHESRIPLRSIHKRFLDASRAAGVPATDYPFSVKNLGRVGLWKYLRKLQESELASAVLARHGKDSARILGSADKGNSEEQIVRPYQNAEFDGHRIDLFCTVSMPSPYGGFVQRVIQRFWILAIIEAVSRAILGYYISLNQEYNANDVLSCVRNAIVPWKPRGLTIPGLFGKDPTGRKTYQHETLECRFYPYC